MDRDLLERLAREAGFVTGNAAEEHTAWADQPLTFNRRVSVSEFAVGDSIARLCALVAEEAAKAADSQAVHDGEETAAQAIRLRFQLDVQEKR